MPRTPSKRRKTTTARVGERAQVGNGRSPRSPSAHRDAVAYSRVSSKDQEREGFSIPAQQAALRAYAAEKGLRIVEEFTDVETAKREGRGAFGKMIAYLKKNARTCRVILVEKTDRLYRNLKDYVTLSEMDLEVHLVKEGAVLSEGSKSAERFMHRIRVLMAQNYIDNLSEEVQKGMRQKAEEGYWPSAAPLGYLNRREAGKSFIVPDPVRAPMVLRVFEQYAAGTHALADLEAWAAQAGFKGKQGGPVKTSVIHSLLRNPLYAGWFSWGGKVYEGKDPTIVTRELWDRVQERLDGHPYTRPVERGFAFTGLITCGHCGAAVTAEVKKEKYVYYHCARRCAKEPFVREERLVEMLGDFLRPLKMPPALAEVAVKALKDSRRDIRKETEARMAEARARYDRLGRLIDAAYEDKLEGRIDADFFARKRAEWDTQRADAQREMARLERADQGSIDLGLRVFELANRAYDLYIRREPAQQRQIVEIVLSNCSLAGGKLTGTYRKPFDLLAELAVPPENDEGPPGGGPSEHSGWWAILDSNPVSLPHAAIIEILARGIPAWPRPPANPDGESEQ
ncbi:recombinase family protein [Myxococcota bacterium]|nr:recombinase family protein [Myxococcota bacterium]